MEETNFTGRAMCGAQHTPQLSCWAAQSRPRCGLQVKHMQMPFRSQIHSPQASGIVKNPMSLDFSLVQWLYWNVLPHFVSCQAKSQAAYFVLGTCRERPSCSHHTLCFCLVHANGTICGIIRHFVGAWQVQRGHFVHSPDTLLVLGRCWCLADAKGTLCACTRHCVGGGQMRRVQCLHSPDAVPGLMACMQCATRAAAACTTAGQIWACSACMVMTTFISSSSSGFSTL